MPVLDIGPLLVFSIDSLLSRASHHAKLLTGIFVAIETILHIPILIVLIRLIRDAFDCIGDSCYIGEFISAGAMAGWAASYTLFLVTAVIYYKGL